MPLYEDRTNAENYLNIDPELAEHIVDSTESVVKEIVRILAARGDEGPPCCVALDGWYGIDWKQLIAAVKKELEACNGKVQFLPASGLFLPPSRLAEMKAHYITDDPGFGFACIDGNLLDLMDEAAIERYVSEIERCLSNGMNVAVYGPGAAAGKLEASAGSIFYFDKTRQPLLWQMWDGKLIPFGTEEPREDYEWKEYYYYDFYLLHNHKKRMLEVMDSWVEGNDFRTMKLVPKRTYDAIVRNLVRQPVKEVKIFQPGPWGAYRYRDLWEVPGLECNAWNELAGPELSMLVAVNGQVELNMPAMNLMQYPELFVGPWLHRHYPDLFPLDVWLDDGYFPEPEPAERISMPIHNHPSTDYVKRKFNEPLGRYETYYIAEAYEGANTWLGYEEQVDLEAWEAFCRESNNRNVIPNWKDFICNWESCEGDLYLIPPGTAHGHGGNQMVLEMDTCPSIAGTEYSFFLYDFARNSWDDRKKTMTGKPVNMHLDHGFSMEKWRRRDWVEKNLRSRPKVKSWTKDCTREIYGTYQTMPFEIERFHFTARAGNDTEGKFMHIITLTVGRSMKIRSLADPQRCCTIDWFQSAIVPACFGPYEMVNEGGGRAAAVLLRWKQG